MRVGFTVTVRVRVRSWAGAGGGGVRVGRSVRVSARVSSQARLGGGGGLERSVPTKAIDLVTTGPDAAVGERQARQSSRAPSACKSSACNRGDN